MSKVQTIALGVIRIILGVVFIISGYLKLAEPLVFAKSIENYQVLNLLLSHWAAMFIPMLELLLGLLLLLRIWPKESFLITFLLYLVFDVMILQAAFRGLDISCGCFSAGDAGPIDFWKILQNILLTVMAGAGSYFYLNDKFNVTRGGNIENCNLF